MPENPSEPDALATLQKEYADLIDRFNHTTRRQADTIQAQAIQIGQQRGEIRRLRDAINGTWIDINYAESAFAGLALRVCPKDPSVDSVLSHTTAARAKLQPFLTKLLPIFNDQHQATASTKP